MRVELGKIVGVWGVKGWIKLHSYTRNRADIANYSTWWLQSLRGSNEPGPTVSVTVEECRQQGRGMVAKLANINTREQAEQLNDRLIMIDKAEMPKLPDGEYYWQQLIGLQVSDTEGEQLGQVDSLLETGANDVLVVKHEQGEEVLIPYTEHVVTEVDLSAGRMIVDWKQSYLQD